MRAATDEPTRQAKAQSSACSGKDAADKVPSRTLSVANETIKVTIDALVRIEGRDMKIGTVHIKDSAHQGEASNTPALNSDNVTIQRG